MKDRIGNDLEVRVAELETRLAKVQSFSPSKSPEPQAGTRVATTLESQFTGLALLRFQKLFLDADLQAHVQTQLPPPDFPLPVVVNNELGHQAQRSQIMSSYFDTVHTWMPIISKLRLEHLSKVELQDNRRADFALLLLCMKLIQTVPKDTSTALRSSLYIVSKEFASSLEIAGIHSLLKLQGNLLLTVYEMGHGIFPAAYMSMSYCVASAIALGIQDKDAPQILETPRTWVDWEERLRVWWIVVILDRYDYFVRSYF